MRAGQIGTACAPIVKTSGRGNGDFEPVPIAAVSTWKAIDVSARVITPDSDNFSIKTSAAGPFIIVKSDSGVLTAAVTTP